MKLNDLLKTIKKDTKLIINYSPYYEEEKIRCAEMLERYNKEKFLYFYNNVSDIFIKDNSIYIVLEQ
jgi:hypothetical protein